MEEEEENVRTHDTHKATKKRKESKKRRICHQIFSPKSAFLSFCFLLFKKPRSNRKASLRRKGAFLNHLKMCVALYMVWTYMCMQMLLSYLFSVRLCRFAGNTFPAACRDAEETGEKGKCIVIFPCNIKRNSVATKRAGGERSSRDSPKSQK